MSNWFSTLCLLAQQDEKKQESMPFWVMIVPFILIFLLFQFMFNPRKRDEKRKAELVSSLKKNDRIVTIGGITGTVASVSEDHAYVTIKVEDNTRIKMLATSIQSVVKDETEESSSNSK